MTPSTTEAPGAMRVIAPWVIPGLFDVYLSFARWPLPEPWQYGFEIVLLALAGRTQWKLARGWGRSPLVPTAVLVFFAAANHMPSGAWHLTVHVAGLCLLLLVTLRWVAKRWSVPSWVGVTAAILVVVVSRQLDVTVPGGPGSQHRASVAAELLWPLDPAWRPESASDAPAVVVISVDTLRADAAADMDVVRRLGARGATWARAMSTSSWTLPAVASLQTGLLPSAHRAGCVARDCQGIADGVPILAEHLRARGYATAAFVSNPWLTGATGFKRGFGLYVEPAGYNRLLIGGRPRRQRPDGRDRVDAALRWWERVPARGFYLWVHLLEPHLPYLNTPIADTPVIHRETLRTSMPLDAKERAAVHAGYAGEVAYVDRHLGRLLDALEAKGVLDDGIVVFTSDHGEEFWEHGGVEHGQSHHAEVLDVPLIVVAPGLAPGPRDGVASLIDVVPTIRAALGDAPDGIDLRQGVPAGRIATAWGGLLVRSDCSARDERRRVIVRDCAADDTAVQVFDLRRDPAERAPIPWQPTEAVVSAARNVSAPAQGRAAPVDRARLRALGYVE
jgi:hypothetical protein